jgi:hypothetical protein
MPEQANVSSVDALEGFRANLILYLNKARPTLEEISNEVLRTKQWLQGDQRNLWEQKIKAHHRVLERVQSELLSARMSKLQDATAAQEMEVHRTQRAIREADDKLRMLKKWDRELDNRSQPLLKLVEQLHGFLTTEMVHAQALLGEMIKSLQAYAEAGPGNSGRSSPPPATDSAAPDAAVNPSP